MGDYNSDYNSDYSGGASTLVTDTDIIQLPVDFFLADYPLYKSRGHERQVFPRNIKVTPVMVRASNSRRGNDR